MISLSILFSGRGSNANSIINLIMKKKLNFKLKNIVCNNKGALGIKLIKKQKFDIKIVDIRSYKDKNQYNIDLERALDPENNDLLLLCGYMSKLPNHIINSYHGNIINIHPSILPKYKGLDTHARVIANKDKIHGCSTHFVTSDIDCGPIIAQCFLPVEDIDDSSSVAEKLLPLEHKLYFHTLKLIEEKRINLFNNKVVHDGTILDHPIKYT